MAKNDQPASYESKRYKAPKKNDVDPVPEIQGKKEILEYAKKPLINQRFFCECFEEVKYWCKVRVTF